MGYNNGLKIKTINMGIPQFENNSPIDELLIRLRYGVAVSEVSYKAQNAELSFSKGNAIKYEAAMNYIHVFPDRNMRSQPLYSVHLGSNPKMMQEGNTVILDIDGDTLMFKEV